MDFYSNVQIVFLSTVKLSLIMYCFVSRLFVILPFLKNLFTCHEVTTVFTEVVIKHRHKRRSSPRSPGGLSKKSEKCRQSIKLEHEKPKNCFSQPESKSTKTKDITQQLAARLKEISTLSSSWFPVAYPKTFGHPPPYDQLGLLLLTASEICRVFV